VIPTQRGTPLLPRLAEARKVVKTITGGTNHYNNNHPE